MMVWGVMGQTEPLLILVWLNGGGFLHQAKDALVPSGQGRGFSNGVVSSGRWQNRGKPGGFAYGEIGSRFSEMMAGSGFCTIDPPSPFGHV